MVDKEFLQKLVESVRDNHRKLEGCAGPHQFVLCPETPPGRSPRYRCHFCQGEVSERNRRWYDQGRQHERQSRLATAAQAGDSTLGKEETGG